MDEVTGLLESELAALFTQDNVVDCDVLPGAAVGERPDEYVSIVAVESEYRAGRAYIVEMEFRSVVPLDNPDAMARCSRRLRQVTDYLAGPRLGNGAILGVGSVTLNIAFYVMRSISSISGERSRAEVARVRFGASVS
jgi:plasmid stabilization system protein ParE